MRVLVVGIHRLLSSESRVISLFFSKGVEELHMISFRIQGRVPGTPNQTQPLMMIIV